MKGKKILLGVTGGIAAYKTAFLIREFIKQGAEVKCIFTPSASSFVSPLTFSTLSQNPVYIDFWNKENGEWTNHVDLALWADLFLIAPLTANTLAKMADGRCDNLLLATYRSAKCQVMVAPAMDLDMYAHPSTIEGLNKIKSFGNLVVPVEKGFLASGLEGEGRMAEPSTIIEAASHFFNKEKSLHGKKIVVTAGPTYEALDPVRFIGNYSSGKMGFAITQSLLNRGAEVILVSGPSNERLEHPNLKLIKVQSALEMFKNVKTHFPEMHGGIFSAAVSDYRPINKSDKKIKKETEGLTLELVKNPDILKWCGENKSSEQWLCGFALETNNEEENAQGKLKRKNLDYIVLNTLNDLGAGFGHDTNKIYIFDKDNNKKEFELMSKKDVAENIIDYICSK
jgi:phosphopantothenoylcysteine decarboxylase/phosphopantothenate--cysteine ligase